MLGKPGLAESCRIASIHSFTILHNIHITAVYVAESTSFTQRESHLLGYSHFSLTRLNNSIFSLHNHSVSQIAPWSSIFIYSCLVEPSDTQRSSQTNLTERVLLLGKHKMSFRQLCEDPQVRGIIQCRLEAVFETDEQDQSQDHADSNVRMAPTSATIVGDLQKSGWDRAVRDIFQRAQSIAC